MPRLACINTLHQVVPSHFLLNVHIYSQSSSASLKLSMRRSKRHTADLNLSLFVSAWEVSGCVNVHQLSDVETRTSTEFDALTLLTEIVTSGKDTARINVWRSTESCTPSCLGSHGIRVDRSCGASLFTFYPALFVQFDASRSTSN